MSKSESHRVTVGKTRAFVAAPDPARRFHALEQAELWAAESGYDIGSVQRDAPIGLMAPRGEWAISKWRGMSRRERAELHGVIIFPAGADGPVEVWVDIARAGH